MKPHKFWTWHELGADPPESVEQAKNTRVTLPEPIDVPHGFRVRVVANAAGLSIYLIRNQWFYRAQDLLVIWSIEWVAVPAINAGSDILEFLSWAVRKIRGQR